MFKHRNKDAVTTTLALKAVHDILAQGCDGKGIIASGPILKLIRSEFGLTNYYATELSKVHAGRLGLRRRYVLDPSRWQLMPWETVTENDLLIVHEGSRERTTYEEELYQEMLEHRRCEEWLRRGPKKIFYGRLWRYQGLGDHFEFQTLGVDTPPVKKGHLYARSVVRVNRAPFRAVFLPERTEPKKSQLILRHIDGMAFYRLATGAMPSLISLQ